MYVYENLLFFLFFIILFLSNNLNLINVNKERVCYKFPKNLLESDPGIGILSKTGHSQKI